MENLKATQLTQDEINKIIRAIELTYGDLSNYDSKAMKLAENLAKAKAVITAK